jgi:hypothetical protein
MGFPEDPVQGLNNPHTRAFAIISEYFHCMDSGLLCHAIPPPSNRACTVGTMAVCVICTTAIISASAFLEISSCQVKGRNSAAFKV